MVAALGATLALVLVAPAAALAAFEVSDLGTGVIVSPAVTAGNQLTYTLNADNNGPDPAINAVLMDTLPPGTTFVSLSPLVGWTCTTPAIGGSGTVTCTNASMAVGRHSFTLVVAVSPSVADGSFLSDTATLSSDNPDPHPDDTATSFTDVVNSADLRVAVTDAPDPADVGQDVTYGIDVIQQGPSSASRSVTLDVPLPANAGFRSASVPGGWSCTVPAVDSTGGTLNCTRSSLATGTSSFALVLRPTATAAGGMMALTATASAITSDPDGSNDAATADTRVNALPPTPSAAGSAYRRPTVTGVTPVSGGSGREVVITGDGFAGVSAVRFGGVPAFFVVDGHGRITAVAPAGRVGETVEVRVTNPAGTNFVTPGARYTFAPADERPSDAPAPPHTGSSRTLCAHIPDLTGKRLSAARRLLRNACPGAKLRIGRHSRHAGRVTVRSQTPAPGTALVRGKQVVLRLR
jgi:uncharacterized repeat protein (TIGR01451 family)